MDASGRPALGVTESGIPFFTEDQKEKAGLLDLSQKCLNYRDACKQLVEEAFELISLHGADASDSDLDVSHPEFHELKVEVEARLKQAQSNVVATMGDFAELSNPFQEPKLHAPSDAERVVVESSRS